MREKEFLKMKEGTEVSIRGRVARYLGGATQSSLRKGIVGRFEYVDTRRTVWKSNRQVKVLKPRPSMIEKLEEIDKDRFNGIQA